jgi:DNA invertase Pin-like site-specific DNA recombinase
MIYGYARVSTDGQSVEAQVRQLAKAGCSKVFREVASGAKTDRTQLRKALDRLEAGDVLMVTRLDRLARSTRDLLNTLATITGKKAGFRSLGDAWADTTTAHRRVAGKDRGARAEMAQPPKLTRMPAGTTAFAATLPSSQFMPVRPRLPCLARGSRQLQSGNFCIGSILAASTARSFVQRPGALTP